MSSSKQDGDVASGIELTDGDPLFYFTDTSGWDVGTADLGKRKYVMGSGIPLDIRRVMSQPTAGKDRVTVLGKHIFVPTTDFMTKYQVVKGGRKTDPSTPLPPDDLLSLPELHHSILLSCLRLRHADDNCYTFLGGLIISLNPFKHTIPAYQSSAMGRYLDYKGETDIPCVAFSRTRDEFGAAIDTGTPPHPWATAHRVYHDMLNNRRNQTIIISGESGAGKTEACKTVLNYLCALSAAGKDGRDDGDSNATPSAASSMAAAAVPAAAAAPSPASTQMSFSPPPLLRIDTANPKMFNVTPMDNIPTHHDIGGTAGNAHDNSASAAAATSTESTASADVKALAKRVIESNPILEAFGNAKTSRNDNSSRFGKYMQLQFSPTGRLLGMKTSVYLLERLRVVYAGKNERLYHAFYMLVFGAPEELRRQLRVMNKTEFEILNASGVTTIRGVNEVEAFQEVEEAFRAMRFSEYEVLFVWRTVAAVLHLSQVFFETEASKESAVNLAIKNLSGGGGGGQSGATIISHDSQERCEFIATELLHIDPERFKQLLVQSETIMTRGHGGQEKMVRNLNKKAAEDQRDTVCKFLYECLFLWIVERVNQETAVNTQQHEVANSIGLLDIFGFEDMPKNSLEQLCINLANEALQRHYAKHVFEVDREEVLAEGVSSEESKFVDNQPCIDLIQGAKGDKSICSILEDLNKLKQTDNSMRKTTPDEDFLERLCKAHRPDWQTNKDRILPRSELTAQSQYFHRDKSTPRNSFVVRHYAADVAYNVDDFVAKNIDQIEGHGMKDLLLGTGDALLNVVLLLQVGENPDGSPLSPLSLMSPARRDGGGANGGPGGYGSGIQSPSLMSPGGGLMSPASFGTPSGAGPRSGRGGPAKTSGSSKTKMNVMSKFRDSLKQLIELIDNTQPNWIRCIRPDPSKEAGKFDCKAVFDQLVGTGVLETIRQRQRNFPYRIPIQTFLQKYGSMLISAKNRRGMRWHIPHAVSDADKVMHVIDSKVKLGPEGRTISKHDAQCGKTKVFLRANAYHRLDMLRSQRASEEIGAIARYMRARISVGIVASHRHARALTTIQACAHAASSVSLFHHILFRRLFANLSLREERARCDVAGREGGLAQLSVYLNRAMNTVKTIEEEQKQQQKSNNNQEEEQQKQQQQHVWGAIKGKTHKHVPPPPLYGTQGAQQYTMQLRQDQSIEAHKKRQQHQEKKGQDETGGEEEEEENEDKKIKEPLTDAELRLGGGEREQLVRAFYADLLPMIEQVKLNIIGYEQQCRKKIISEETNEFSYREYDDADAIHHLFGGLGDDEGHGGAGNYHQLNENIKDEEEDETFDGTGFMGLFRKLHRAALRRQLRREQWEREEWVRMYGLLMRSVGEKRDQIERQESVEWGTITVKWAPIHTWMRKLWARGEKLRLERDDYVADLEAEATRERQRLEQRANLQRVREAQIYRARVRGDDGIRQDLNEIRRQHPGMTDDAVVDHLNYFVHSVAAPASTSMSLANDHQRQRRQRHLQRYGLGGESEGQQTDQSMDLGGGRGDHHPTLGHNDTIRAHTSTTTDTRPSATTGYARYAAQMQRAFQLRQQQQRQQSNHSEEYEYDDDRGAVPPVDDASVEERYRVGTGTDENYNTAEIDSRGAHNADYHTPHHQGGRPEQQYRSSNNNTRTKNNEIHFKHVTSTSMQQGGHLDRRQQQPSIRTLRRQVQQEHRDIENSDPLNAAFNPPPPSNAHNNNKGAAEVHNYYHRYQTTQMQKEKVSTTLSNTHSRRHLMSSHGGLGGRGGGYSSQHNTALLDGDGGNYRRQTYSNSSDGGGDHDSDDGVVFGTLANLRGTTQQRPYRR